MKKIHILYNIYLNHVLSAECIGKGGRNQFVGFLNLI